jgi:hypothetical protein
MATRDQSAANAEYYRRNRRFESQRVRIRQAATRDRLRELRSVPCLDCGGTYEPHQMDFDHREPRTKSFRLTAGTAMLASAGRLKAEIAKCDVVCANCHRIRTQRRVAAEPRTDASPELVRKRRYWRAQLAMLERLKQRPCTDCGGHFPGCAMDFDHREPREKRYTVSRMVGRAGTKRIMAEVAKCDIVCANCHRDRTYRRREAGSSERE